MAKLKILFISAEYPELSGWGGIATYTHTIARALAKRGHEVHVLALHPEGTTIDLLEDMVHIHRRSSGVNPLPAGRIWYPFRVFCYKTIPHTLERLAWALQVKKCAASIASTVGKFDVVEYPECGGEGLLLPAKVASTRICRLHTPWSIICKFDEINESWLDRFFLDCIESHGARRANLVTTPSHAIATHLRGWRLKKVEHYVNPINTAELVPSSGSGWLYLGRVEKNKGIELLLGAYARCLAHGPVPPLTIVGRPFGMYDDRMDYGAYIGSLFDRYNLGGNVQWIEGVPHAQVAGYLKQNSVVIVPSLWENCPYVILEAMGAGCTVVGSDAGGIPELISPNVNGLLFKSNNVDALTAVLSRLRDDGRIAARLGLAAREHVARNFSLDARIEAIEERYLLAGGRKNV